MTQSGDLDCADVLVHVYLFYPHDALEKVTTFDNDAHVFLRHLSSPDVCASGLDFHRKILDLDASGSPQDFLSGTTRAGWTWIYGARSLNPSYALDLEVLDFLHSGVRVSGRT